MAALKALTFAHELGFQNVILEGNALGFIQALKSQEQNLCPLGLRVEDVKVYANNFRRFSSIPNFQVWMEDVPSHIVFFFTFGCNSFTLIKLLKLILKKKKKMLCCHVGKMPTLNSATFTVRK